MSGHQVGDARKRAGDVAHSDDGLRVEIAKAIHHPAGWLHEYGSGAMCCTAASAIADAVLAVVGEYVAAVERECDEALARAASYEHRISWNTTCEGCANLLDKSYEDHCRAEKAEATVERVAAITEDLWRVSPCGCGHRADLHGWDSGCIGGLSLCPCNRTFSSIVYERLRAALDTES